VPLTSRRACLLGSILRRSNSLPSVNLCREQPESDIHAQTSHTVRTNAGYRNAVRHAGHTLEKDESAFSPDAVLLPLAEATGVRLLTVFRIDRTSVVISLRRIDQHRSAAGRGIASTTMKLPRRAISILGSPFSMPALALLVMYLAPPAGTLMELTKRSFGRWNRRIRHHQRALILSGALTEREMVTSELRTAQ